MTEEEAKAEGFELEDYETEVIEIWPDNELPIGLFRMIGTRWRYPPMGGPPTVLDWPSVYPLMDRLKLSDDEWNALHSDIMLMEVEAIKAAPKPKSDTDL